MKVFVTGATGYIGRTTVEQLIKNGHQVIGLARNDNSKETLQKLGAEAHIGDLNDPESLHSGAKKADGVIHLAFDLDFNNLGGTLEKDRAAIKAMADAMKDTGNPLVIASGTLVMPKGKVAIEEDAPVRDMPPLTDRVESEELVFRVSKEQNIRGVVVRYAGNLGSQYRANTSVG